MSTILGVALSDTNRRQPQRAPLLLRVTIRCLDEDLLGAAASDAERPTEELDHQLVRKFIALRSQDPTGIEKIQPMRNASEVSSLHAGRWRGATWHDRHHTAVWLLAGAFHRSGARDDAYRHFKDLDASGRLMPSADDYLILLRLQVSTFVDELTQKVPTVVAEARRRSPAEFHAMVGAIPISVALVIDETMEFVYLAVSISGWDGTKPEPPADWMTMLWAVFFPWVSDPLTEISAENEIAGRPATSGELIYCAIREA